MDVRFGQIFTNFAAGTSLLKERRLIRNWQWYPHSKFVSIRLYFDGILVDDSETPEILEMEDDDELHVEVVN